MTPKTVSRQLLDPDPNQPRLNTEPEDIKPLARSVRELGQLQPIIVFSNERDRFTIVDGHRRFAASGMAQIEELSALVLDSRPDRDTLLLTQLAANCMRVDLKPTEKALAFQRLKESRKWTNTELANAMHVSKATVTRVLSYLQLPLEARAQLDAGELPSSTAYAIARAADSDTRNALTAEAANGKLKRDDAQRRVERNGKSKQESRRTFRLPGIEITVATLEPIELATIVKRLQSFICECRKAIKDGIDAPTLEHVLISKQRSKAKK